MLRGRVLDLETKAPIGDFNVKVDVHAGSQQHGRNYSTRDGRFALEELHLNRGYEVTVEAGGYPSVTKKDLRPQLEGSAEETVFYLSRSVLRGVVVYAGTGMPVPGAEVHYAHLTGDQVYWQGLVVATGHPLYRDLRHVFADAAGRFELDEGTQKGWLFVEAEGLGRLAVSPGERAPLLTSDILRIPLEPESVLSLSVSSRVVALRTCGSRPASSLPFVAFALPISDSIVTVRR